MKFVMSYSCGKDSTLALHKMIEQGNEPVALLIMVNQAVHRSYFHGADYRMLRGYSEALGIPLLAVPTNGAGYHLEMEKNLYKAIEMGAKAACFGDIDIENNRAWSEERCNNTGIEAVFPLWQKDRMENVYEVIDLGYQCLIKSINQTLLPKSFLGKILDRQVIDEMRQYGIDLCGENGEYHTLVIDGPIFQKPLAYQTGDVMDFGDYAAIEVTFA